MKCTYPLTALSLSYHILCFNTQTALSTDCGHSFAASVRIGVGGQKKKSILEASIQFSAATTVFSCVGLNSEGDMILRMIEGPLKREEYASLADCRAILLVFLIRSCHDISCK